MCGISTHIVAAIAIATMAMTKENTAPPPYRGLLLSVETRDLQEKARNRFAISEPIWLSVRLQNTSSVPASLLVDQGPKRGLICRPARGYETKATIVHREIALERNFKRVVLDPGEEIRIDVPMSEYFRVQEEGEFVIACEMIVKDEWNRVITVNGSCEVWFAGRLDAQEIRTLVDQLQEGFDSGDEDTRVRMVKSSSFFPPSAVMNFLAKALSDKSERVQLAAVEVLSSLNGSDEQVLSLLQTAAKSEKKSVQRRATMAIEQRQRK